MNSRRVLSIIVGSVFAATLAVGAILYKGELDREALQGQFTNEHSKFMTLKNQAQVHYRDQGNPKGPVLVMIHGSLNSLHQWEGWIPPLSAKFRLISLDLLGHGLTGAYPAKIYERQAQRDAVHELLEKLDVHTYYLAGSSAGASIALELALLYPEETRGLVLIDAQGITPPQKGEDPKLLNQGVLATPKSREYTQLKWHERWATRFVGESALRNALERMVHNKSLIDDATVERVATLLRHQGNREAQLLMFRQGLYLISKNPAGDLLPRLTEIKAPVLLMHGQEDALVPPSVATNADKVLAKSELTLVPQAGHLPMLEKPLHTARRVEAFIEGQESSAPLSPH